MLILNTRLVYDVDVVDVETCIWVSQLVRLSSRVVFIPITTHRHSTMVHKAAKSRLRFPLIYFLVVVLHLIKIAHRTALCLCA